MISWICTFLLIVGGDVYGSPKKNTPALKKATAKIQPKAEPEPTLAPLESDFIGVPMPETPAKQILIVEENQGLTLLQRQADEPMPPSSMIKILAAHTALDLMNARKMSLDTNVIVSPEASKQEGSTMFAEPNKPVSLYQLLQGLIIVSGNDAAKALAESICGSEKAFAEHMTKKAHQIGAVNTNCPNSSGLPDPAFTTNCRDLIIIARAFMKDYPQHYALFGEAAFTHNNITQPNRNPFTGWGLYPCDGVKTGFTDAAGYGAVGSCLSSAPSNTTSWRFISVMNGLASKVERAAEAKKITTWVFQHFACVDCPIRIKVPVKLGDRNETVIGANVKLTLAREQKASICIEHPDHLRGEQIQGSQVGIATISSPGWKKTITVPVIVLEGVKKLGGIAGAWQRMRLMFANKPQIITHMSETPLAIG